LEPIILPKSKGATLKILNQPIFDTGSPTGKFVIQLLGPWQKWNKPRFLNAESEDKQPAGQSAAKIAEQLGITRPSVDLALKSPLENAVV